jgi:hypothetical protein
MCADPQVPPYLHYHLDNPNTPLHPPEAFLDEHKLYRAGNPIEFPSGTITALSCKWSYLIAEGDVLKTPPPATAFCFAFVHQIRGYRYLIQKTEGEHLGWHELTCCLQHQPQACDYSHCEILICHCIYQDEAGTEKHWEAVYAHSDWPTALLNKGGLFSKNFAKTTAYTSFNSSRTQLDNS